MNYELCIMNYELLKKWHSNDIGEIGFAEHMIVHRHASVVANDIDMTRRDGMRFHVPVAWREIQPWALGNFIVQIKDAVTEFDDVSFDGENAFEKHDPVATIADHDNVAVGWFAFPIGWRPAENKCSVMVCGFHAEAFDDSWFADKSKEPIGDGGDANQSNAKAYGDFRKKKIHQCGTFFLSHGNWFLCKNHE